MRKRAIILCNPELFRFMSWQFFQNKYNKPDKAFHLLILISVSFQSSWTQKQNLGNIAHNQKRNQRNTFHDKLHKSSSIVPELRVGWVGREAAKKIQLEKGKILKEKTNPGYKPFGFLAQTSVSRRISTLRHSYAVWLLLMKSNFWVRCQKYESVFLLKGLFADYMYW